MTWFYTIAGIAVVGIIVYFVMGKKKGGSQGPSVPPTTPPTE